MKKRFALFSALTLGVGWLIGCASAPKNVTHIPAPNSDPSGQANDRLGSPMSRSAPSPNDRPARGDSFQKLPRKPAPDRGIDSAVLADARAEELWVIYRPERGSTTARDDQYPGTGALMTRVDDREVPLTLRHTDVKASVSGYIASVDVTQQFANPFTTKIEAVYVFPLPENGAVNEFVMQVGTRRIRGIVRERAEAERIYNEAKHQGYTASLLTQERPNIFTQSVANIEPGKRIDISIRYYNTLAYVDGWYEFVFPMVVGPRFNPSGSRNGIGAVPASGVARSGQPTDVHYLRPETRAGQDISLEVSVSAGVEIEELECKTHAVLVRSDEGGSWEPIHSAQSGRDHVAVRLDPKDSIPNKDFVLRYRVAGGTIKSSVITHEDRRGGFFTLMLYPPAVLESLERAPLELVFVLDCSGSMSGKPLEQAKAAIRWALRHMDTRDTFQLINFSVDARQFGRTPVPADSENIRRALAYLDSLQSEGGTMMIEGVKAALDFPHDSSRLRFVCFLTDGYIGNEAEILSEVHARLRESRIFSFGVGSSVNRYLLDSMAKVGRGTVAYLGLNDDGGKVMRDFYERISHPALTDVKIDWRGLKVSSVFPKRMPDLFVGRPLIVTGRFDADRANATKMIELSGKAGGSRVRLPITFKRSSLADSAPGLPSIWARMRIAELMGTGEGDHASANDVRKTALDFQLLSPYTAFIALDASRRTAGAEGVTVPVAVSIPEGVRYETTVTE